MSLLTVVQYFCRRTNLAVPTTVIGSTEEQISQIQGLLEEEGNDLQSRAQWQSLIYEFSLTTTATTSQGTMDTICPNGFRNIINNTLWSRTRRLPVSGPMDPVEWQQLKAMFVNGPYYRHRIRGNELLVNPDPPAGESWYGEYVSSNWISDAAGVNFKKYFTADDDVILLPEALVIAGLRWRWKKEKNLDYAEDFRSYEMQVKDAIGRDGGKRHLRMDNWNRGPTPGIWVAPGNWSVP